MTDNFLLLDEPRRPWLDPEALKQKFLSLSAEVHPDRAHQLPAARKEAATKCYAELNAAYQCLRDPKERLRHLLELETGAKPAEVQAVPPELVDSSFEIGRLCKETDAFLVEKVKVTSLLLQVQLFERSQEWTGRLMSLQRDIQLRQDELMNELKGMNSAWESTAALREPVGRLEQIYHLLGYYRRWSEQLRERVVRLAV
jgi:DnaJ-domain-containing protein 1